MKKILFAFFALTVAGFAAFANDTYFFASGGNLVPQEEKDVAVQMKSEVISLKLEKKHYEVNVDFEFYNSGESTELLVGFPFFEAGIGGHGKIYDFKCWTDGKLTDFSDMPIEHEFSNHNFDAAELQNAYARKITFPKNMTTRTRVNYKSEYGLDTTGYIVKYLYGTGSSWKDPIGKMTVVLENNLPYDYINEISGPGEKSAFSRIDDNKWKAEFTNVEPEYTDCITVRTIDVLGDTGPRCFPSYGFGFRDKEANEKWLFWYTRPQLRIVRNAIYALHGYDFKSEDMKELFTSWGKSWNPKYEVNPDFSENDLTEIEKHNINLLLEGEKERDRLYFK